jgi:hypothetical protein
MSFFRALRAGVSGEGLTIVKNLTSHCPGADPATCTKRGVKICESLCILTIDKWVKKWYNMYVR